MGNKTECPVCDFLLEMSDGTVAGELIECKDCGTELEIIGVNPFKVKEAPMEDEDWGE